METKETKIPLKKRSTSYKINIPDKVESIIRFLCEKVWTTEWSGVLFYNTTGSFAAGDLVVHCVDILPMDIGNATYTEFNMSPDVISYMAQNQELLDCKTGLIHSHNNMSTFFSGTDLSTLQEEGSERNEFVSLIVNNAGDYTAAITRKIKFNTTTEYYYDDAVLPIKETFTGEEVEYFNLEIVFENPPKSKFKELNSRLDEIKAKKPVVENVKWNESYTTKTPTVVVDDELIDKVVVQLLSGGVSITKVDDATREKLIKTLDARFDKRFGSDERGFKSFTYWATDFIEFLLWYGIPDDEWDDDKTADLATAVLEIFGKYPKSKYIEGYRDILGDYVARLY